VASGEWWVASGEWRMEHQFAPLEFP
jgi:hypothetical protein